MSDGYLESKDTLRLLYELKVELTPGDVAGFRTGPAAKLVILDSPEKLSQAATLEKRHLMTVEIGRWLKGGGSFGQAHIGANGELKDESPQFESDRLHILLVNRTQYLPAVATTSTLFVYDPKGEAAEPLARASSVLFFLDKN